VQVLGLYWSNAYNMCISFEKKKHELADGQVNESLDAIKLPIVMNCIDQKMLPNVHQLLLSSTASLGEKKSSQLFETDAAKILSIC
jgi:hypothetical protein